MNIRAILSLLAEPPWPVLTAITLGGWAMVAGYSHGPAMSALCVTATGAWYDQGWRAFQAALLTLSPSGAALSWVLMLVAMMTPILSGPVMHLWSSSLARRRWRAIAVFLAGYGGVWLALGPVLTMTAMVLQIAGDALGVPALALSAAVAFAWQATPWKQVCLNRCHWTPRISLFGRAADRDCLRYGVVNAGWCVGTCWALMLVSLTTVSAHLPVMALAASVMIAERLRPARPARWSLPGLERLMA